MTPHQFNFVTVLHSFAPMRENPFKEERKCKVSVGATASFLHGYICHHVTSVFAIRSAMFTAFSPVLVILTWSFHLTSKPYCPCISVFYSYQSAAQSD